MIRLASLRWNERKRYNVDLDLLNLSDTEIRHRFNGSKWVEAASTTAPRAGVSEQTPAAPIANVPESKGAMAATASGNLSSEELSSLTGT